MMSGGKASWAAGKLVARRHGTADLVHLFADTRYEDEDLYRFLPEAAANVGGRLVTVCDGRTPWQVFRDTRLLGNARVAKCSHVLKQAPCRRWLEEHADPADTTLYVGIAWHERHRLETTPTRTGIRDNWLPWLVKAPLTEPPYLSDAEIVAWLEREGIDPPRLYDEGFPHNNCGGRCVRGGQAAWRHLLRTRPESYAEVEAEEEAMRAFLGKDVAILRDRRGGKTVPLPLAELRRRVEAGEGCDLLDWGRGCDCMLGPE
jgi:3'-phosphoadenosine 5'-phosphosulfate sulfotransferase (PAPS reductase)/FAD synthetase